MSTAEDEKKNLVIAAAGAVATVAAAITFKDLGASESAALVLSSFAGQIPALIRVGSLERAERRSRLAAKGMAAAFGDTKNLPETPGAQDVYVAMFHDLMDAVDDGAAAPLGNMAAEYARLGLRPDQFFRAFGRVVRELGAEEIRDLERLLDDTVTRIDSHRAAFADSSVVRASFRDPVGHQLEVKGPGDDAWSPALEVTQGTRLLSLMKQSGLALEPTNLPGAVGFQPMMALIRHGFASRALGHLRAVAP
jgi:hypothetical protein